MKTVASTFTLVAVVVLVILDACTVTEAWRPQGRFGKRRLDTEGPQQTEGGLEALASGEKSSTSNSIPTLQKADGSDNSGYPVDLDMPVFQHGNIICINKGVKGLFRCVRWVSDTTSD